MILKYGAYINSFNNISSYPTTTLDNIDIIYTKELEEFLVENGAKTFQQICEQGCDKCKIISKS